ncbi:basic blue protein-like [Rhododendron vialii]|uniref:basic blue protein-like n=1 Tax=Rhododendron vialii TaxID=182163 RepID=UPI00265F2E77|nr:basic blue protein-like [Rhododendron vialii]
MPSQGRRGSALVAAAVALVCLSSVLNFEVAQARIRTPKTYTVGGAKGWTFGVGRSWPGKKQHFRAGDTLVFKYAAEQHNVLVVNKAGYRSCNAPANAPSYWTGNDNIKLVKGHNYFMCGFPGHCRAGMRISVIAAK